jgi:hypothetical protein
VFGWAPRTSTNGFARASEAVIWEITLYDFLLCYFALLMAIPPGWVNPVMKLVLIAAPVVASYLPTVPVSTLVTKRTLFLVGNRKSNGDVQPLDEFSLNQLARGGVVFAHEPPRLRYIELCAGVSWHRPKRGDGDKDSVEGARKRPPT